MARRRLAHALGGLGQGLSDVASTLLSNSLSTKRQNRQITAGLEKEQLDAFNTAVAGLSNPEAVAKVGPERTSAQYQQLRRRLPASMQQYAGTQPDFTGLDAPLAERASPVRRRIQDATKAEAVPGELGIQGLMQSEARANPAKSGEAFDLLGLLTQEANSKRTALEGAEPLTPVTDFSSGVGTTTYKTRGQLPGVSAQMERTSGQEAARSGAVTGAQQQATQTVLNTPANQTGRARGAGMEAGARRAAELAAELAAMGITGQQQTGALALADDFTKQNQDFVATRAAFQTVGRLANQDSAAGDLGLIFAFMKSLDPASTVREGEFANAQNAAGIPTRIWNLYNKIVSGERLAPQQRQDFVQTSRTMYTAAKADHDALVKDFTARALQLRVPPSMVVREQAEPSVPADYLSTDPNAGTPLGR